MNAQRYWLTLTEAAAIAYPRGWRKPLVDEIDQQRAIEARESRRHDDKYPEETDENS